MLGPELLNMTVRPTPIFLEGTASLRIDQPGPRELGLANFQVVKGLVSIDRGQLFINLAGVAQPLLAPDFLKRYAGQSIFFRVQLTPDGATVLRPVPAPAAAPGQAQPRPQKAQLQGGHTRCAAQGGRSGHQQEADAPAWPPLQPPAPSGE